MALRASRAVHGSDREVLTAGCPEEALALLSARNQIDPPSTDVVMRRLNGPELARRIQQARAARRVPFVSGSTENTVERHGVLNGEARFLPKPHTREQLPASARQTPTRA